jgi:hypothetical protein
MRYSTQPGVRQDFGILSLVAGEAHITCSLADALKARSGENPARTAKPGNDVQGEQISQIMACLIFSLVS